MKRQFFLRSALLILAILLQLGTMGVFTEKIFSADILLMAVLAWSILEGFSAFLPWLIWAGLLYDAATFTNWGVHVVIFVCVTYFASFFSRRFSVNLNLVGFGLLLLFVVVGTFFSEAALFFVNLEQLPDLFTSKHFLSRAGWLGVPILVNTLLFFVWFGLLKKLKARGVI